MEDTKKSLGKQPIFCSPFEFPGDSVYRPNDIMARSSNPTRFETKKGAYRTLPLIFSYNKLVSQMQQFFGVVNFFSRRGSGVFMQRNAMGPR